MAVKIKLARIGKIREPFYRIVVADARTRRSGRAIEAIGKYHPKNDPSVIEIDSERAQYWLSVGAQPTESVEALLKVTGDWQKFKGLPGTEGTLKAAAGEGRQARAVRGRHRRHRQRRRHRGHHPAPQGRRQAGRRAPLRPSPSNPCSPRRWSIWSAASSITPTTSTSRWPPSRQGRTLQVRVHPDDLGKVIGRNGRTATALRTVMTAVGGRGIRVDVVDTDR